MCIRDRSQRPGTAAPGLSDGFLQAVGCDRDKRMFCVPALGDPDQLAGRVRSAELAAQTAADRRWLDRFRAAEWAATEQCERAVRQFESLLADAAAGEAERLHDGHMVRILGTRPCHGPPRQLEPILRVPPRYPKPMLRDGVEGWASFVMLIGPDGQVIELAATEALERWKFRFVGAVNRDAPLLGIQLINFSLSP